MIHCTSRFVNLTMQSTRLQYARKGGWGCFRKDCSLDQATAKRLASLVPRLPSLLSGVSLGTRLAPSLAAHAHKTNGLTKLIIV